MMDHVEELAAIMVSCFIICYINMAFFHLDKFFNAFR